MTKQERNLNSHALKALLKKECFATETLKVKPSPITTMIHLNKSQAPPGSRTTKTSIDSDAMQYLIRTASNLNKSP